MYKRQAEGSDLLSIELTTTGDYEYLRIPRGENACPMYRHPSERPVLHMNGREVYKFAVNAMVTGLQLSLIHIWILGTLMV